MASLAKRPDGRWRARYRDEAGREHARHFARTIDAQQWLDGVTASFVRGDHVDPKLGRMTVVAYAGKWLAVQRIRDTSRRTYSAWIRNRITPVLGGHRLSSVTRTDVLAFRRGLEQELSENTVRQVMALLAGIFSAAVEDGYLAKSPGRDTLPIVLCGRSCSRSPSSRSRPCTRRPRTGTRGWSCSERLRSAHRCGARTQARTGPVPRARARRRRAAHPRAGAPPRLAPPKTRGSRRTVPMADVVAVALARHLEAFPAGPDDLICRTRVGTPVWPDSFNAAVWQPLRKRAGVPHARFHDPRRFTASALIRCGESVKTVSAVLGHSDESEVLRTYSHLWPDAE